MLTKDQAQRLVQDALDLRPTGAPRWDPEGVWSVLQRLSAYELATLMLVVARAASDATAKTPGVMLDTKGPHWRERIAPAATPRNVDARHRCTICGLSEDACRMRWAADHDFEHDPRRTDVGEHIDHLRALLDGPQEDA